MPNSPRFVLGSIYALCILIGLMVLSKALANGPPAVDQEQSASAGCCRIIELRQYLLKPGQRDALVALFDREFVETQEAEGMRILDQFTDETNPPISCGFADLPTCLLVSATSRPSIPGQRGRNSASRLPEP
jgi:hypothetical protein